MFHEDPYRGDSNNDQISRLEFCRSDHGDDLMVVLEKNLLKVGDYLIVGPFNP